MRTHRQPRIGWRQESESTTAKPDRLPPPWSLNAPEWVLALLLFLFHFIWEMLQTPFFATMSEMPHWPATLICLRATLGDAGIGVLAFEAMTLLTWDRSWFLHSSTLATLGYVAFGVLATVALEIHALSPAHRWVYSDLMPIIPGLGIGLVPLLQWLILPCPVLYLLKRHYLGTR